MVDSRTRKPSGSRKIKAAKKVISSLKRNNRRMKLYHKNVKKQLFSAAGCPSDSDSETVELERQVKDKDATIDVLEYDRVVLEEQIKEMETAVKSTKSDGKSYSPNTRMMVYEALVCQTPTANIPRLIQKMSARCGVTLNDVPSRTTVEAMARELGVIAELQTGEMLMENPHSTIGFDATTQEGAHVNEIHFSTKTNCLSAAVDELAGGTAQDYHDHICDTVDRLATVYVHFNGGEYATCRQEIIANISNSLTDRCAANHATIKLLNETWDSSLNELNCHLHPLDSISTKVKAAVKSFEKQEKTPKKIKGSDCLVGDIVVQLNKMRYKDSKGDPKGFIIFLQENNLPRGILPRYRGNRLHIIFHICGVLFQHYDIFEQYLRKGPTLGGLRASVHGDFVSPLAKVELQILGLIGKVLTGPWMELFYRSSSDQINHVEGIQKVKEVLAVLQELKECPSNILSMEKDVFHQEMDRSDQTWQALRVAPTDIELFDKVTKCSIEGVIEVLQRQYKRYFDMEITDMLHEETESARLHNIDSEQLMGMYSAIKSKAPSAKLCYVSSKLRAVKNKTVDYLDQLEVEKRDAVIRTAVNLAKNERIRRRKKQKELMEEIAGRLAEKEQNNDEKMRRKVEKVLKKLGTVDASSVEKEFPDLNENQVETLVQLVNGKCVGYRMCHIWYEDKEQVAYNGLLERVFGKGMGKKYVVSYWLLEKTMEDSTEYDMSVYALGADFILKDLTI